MVHSRRNTPDPADVPKHVLLAILLVEADGDEEEETTGSPKLDCSSAGLHRAVALSRTKCLKDSKQLLSDAAG